MKYYLFGTNIQTSLSPRIHNFLFKIKQYRKQYQPPRSGATMTVGDMLKDQFGGASITIPFKKHYAKQQLIRKQGELTKKHGISNTIYKKSQQRQLYSTNTDLFGIQQCFNSQNHRLQQKNALILGAGATAQIFAFFFEKLQFKASFINRSQERLKQMEGRFTNLSHLIHEKSQLPKQSKYELLSSLINTVPSEAIDQNTQAFFKPLSLMLAAFPRNQKTRMIYFNVNYRNSYDPVLDFLKDKTFLHIQTLLGIDMLLWQAIQQNRLFCDEESSNTQKDRWFFEKLKRELML